MTIPTYRGRPLYDILEEGQKEEELPPPRTMQEWSQRYPNRQPYPPVDPNPQPVLPKSATSRTIFPPQIKFVENYPPNVPQPHPGYVAVGNRDLGTGKTPEELYKWYKTGSPINQEDVGKTTFESMKGAETFDPSHHGMHFPKQTYFSDEELREDAKKWGLPEEGNRDELFGRTMRMEKQPLYKMGMAGEETGEDLERLRNRIIDPNKAALQEAQAARAARAPSQSLNQAVQQERVPISGFRMAQQPRALANAVGGEAQVPAVAGRSAASGLSNLAKFAGRAMPLINIALLGSSLINSSRDRVDSEREATQRRGFKT